MILTNIKNNNIKFAANLKTANPIKNKSDAPIGVGSDLSCDKFEKNIDPRFREQYKQLYAKLSESIKSKNVSSDYIAQKAQRILHELYNEELGYYYCFATFMNIKNEDIAEFLKIADNDVQMDIAMEIAVNKTYLNKYKRLIENTDMDIYDIKYRSIMTDIQEKVADKLLSNNVSKSFAYSAAYEMDKDWNDYFLYILKNKNIDETDSYLVAKKTSEYSKKNKDEDFDFKNYAEKLLDLGLTVNQISYLYSNLNNSSNTRNNIIHCLENGLCFDSTLSMSNFNSNIIDYSLIYAKSIDSNPIDMANILNDAEIAQQYQSLIDEGYKPYNASVLSNINCINDSAFEDVSNIIDVISQGNDNLNFRVSTAVENFFNNTTQIDLGKLSEYLQNLDFEKLSEIEPSIKDFDPYQKLIFANYHCTNNTNEFNTQTLSLDTDLTQFLMNNYLDADSLNDLMTIFPSTPKNVGSIPQDWMNGINPDNKDIITNKIYLAILKFQLTDDIDKFQSEMTKILNKNTDVSIIETGTFGTGYKISIYNCNDTCLKIFKETKPDKLTINRHGTHIEPQTALFANAHSNHFVKMFFGRVSPKNDNEGFLVTQYLTNDTSVINTNPIDTNMYKISCSDAYGSHNRINGKIIDYGDVIVKNAQDNSLIKWKINSLYNN